MQPQAFDVNVSFAQEEAQQVSGRGQVRTAALDALFAMLETTISVLLANLRLIQRDDGELLDGIVKVHALNADVLGLIASGAFTVRGSWSPTAYATGDIVESGGFLYLSLVAHTGEDFATDLAAGLWAQFFATGSATNTSFAPTATLESTNVQAAIEEVDAALRTQMNIYMHDNFGGI